jgi:hypothetical protein
MLVRLFAGTTQQHDEQCDDDSDNKGEEQFHA